MLINDMEARKQPSSTPATSGGVTRAINTQPVRLFLANYANSDELVRAMGSVWMYGLYSESRMDYRRGIPYSLLSVTDQL